MADLTLQDAARKFLAEFKDIPVTKGRTKDRLEATGMFKKLTGARALVYAIEDYIGNNQGVESIDANEKLLERLKGDKGIISIISDIAIAGPEELAQKEKLLRGALQLSVRREDSTLFDAMSRAVGNIARDTDLHLSDGGLFGDDSPGKRPKDDEEKKRDEGTWRESLHKKPDDSAPDVSSQDIAKSAQQFDSSGNAVNDNDIKRSASQGNNFSRKADDLTPYEKLERSGKGGADYFQTQGQNLQEGAYYEEVAMLMGRVFNATLGKCLERLDKAKAALKSLK